MNFSEPESSRPQAPGLRVELGAKPKRLRATRWLAIGVGLVGVLAATAVWISGQSTQTVAGSFGQTGAAPTTIAVNSPTLVTFTSRITDPKLKKRSVILLRLDASGKPSDILGRLKDDGLNGDAVANDGVYTLQTTLNESSLGQVGFRVAARFKPGIWREPEPDDDNWDTLLANRPTDLTARKAWLLRLLLLLGRYQLSGVFTVAVKQPTITWSADQQVVLSQGENATRNISFSSDLFLKDVVIEPSSDISSFLAIAPNNFATIQPNASQSAQLNFTIPPGTTLGTYQGTIHVRVGTQTPPQTLKVTVNAWIRYVNATAPITFEYPIVPNATLVVNRDATNTIYLDSRISPTRYAHILYLTVDHIEGFSSVHDWFVTNVDSSGKLLVGTYTQYTDSMDGRSILLLTGGMPADWDGGSLVQAYVLRADLSQLVTVQVSQDDPLEYYGMTSAQAEALINGIIETIQFR
jgi:hypothetical protein